MFTFIDQVSDIELDGIDTTDAPDFCDAFITDATINGRKATSAELDELNEDRQFVYEKLMEHLY